VWPIQIGGDATAERVIAAFSANGTIQLQQGLSKVQAEEVLMLLHSTLATLRELAK
jgi:hypothetical protein